MRRPGGAQASESPVASLVAHSRPLKTSGGPFRKGKGPAQLPNSVGRVNKKTPDANPDTKGRIAGPVDVKTFGKQLADRQRVDDARLARRSKQTGALMLAGGRWTAHDLRRTAASAPMERLHREVDLLLAMGLAQRGGSSGYEISQTGKTALAAQGL